MSYHMKEKRPILIPRCCGWVCKKLSRSNCTNSQVDQQQFPDTTQNSTLVQTMDDPVPMNCCCSFVCPQPVDAIDFYSNRIDYLVKKMEAELQKVENRKIGVVFVRFSTRIEAVKVCRDYRKWCDYSARFSSVSDRLRTYTWSVDFAPLMNDIIWSNLSLPRTLWWVRAIIINVVVFLFVFFLTTPTYFLNLVNTIQLTELIHLKNPFLLEIFPSIILWSVAALLPYLVCKSDFFVRHWTKSGLHLTVMTKTFTMLILMVLVLPSLGLTSISALLDWFFPVLHLLPINQSSNRTARTSALSILKSFINDVVESDNATTNSSSPAVDDSRPLQWECVFMPDNGAFFVNYVITSAFIGTALKLVRIPDLLLYIISLLRVRSKAEKIRAYMACQYEFEFGLFYAWNLCMFAVIMVYSILCPLITPFGFIYLIFRYLVERHNLYYIHLPSRIDARTHFFAINSMLFSVLLLQLNIFIFIALRSQLVSKSLFIVSFLILLVAFLMFFSNAIGAWIFVGSKNVHRQMGDNVDLSAGSSDPVAIGTDPDSNVPNADDNDVGSVKMRKDIDHDSQGHLNVRISEVFASHRSSVVDLIELSEVSTVRPISSSSYVKHVSGTVFADFLDTRTVAERRNTELATTLLLNSIAICQTQVDDEEDIA